jgi:hypothetical protein
MWSMRRLILRRSVSSWVSPGPRVPLPPPSCDKARPRPARRGSWYSSCASSTWSWPSRVLAWRAKMSRMSCERSMTWQGSRDSMLRSCEGVRSWSKRTSEALVEATTSTISSSLPWPTRLEGSGLWRRWTSVTAMVAPADRASSRILRGWYRSRGWRLPGLGVLLLQQWRPRCWQVEWLR